MQKRRFDRVDQSHLLVDHQKSVIGAAAPGFITVKIAYVPIDGTDPVDVIGDLFRFKEILHSLTS